MPCIVMQIHSLLTGIPKYTTIPCVTCDCNDPKGFGKGVNKYPVKNLYRKYQLESFRVFLHKQRIPELLYILLIGVHRK